VAQAVFSLFLNINSDFEAFRSQIRGRSGKNNIIISH
jgi:hypothetical protein